MQIEATMFRITIRELLCLTTIAALAIGWLIHKHSEQTSDQFLQIQLMEQRLQEASDLVAQLQSLTNHKSESTANQME